MNPRSHIRVDTDPMAHQRSRWADAPHYMRRGKLRLSGGQSAAVGIIAALICLALGWHGLFVR